MLAARSARHVRLARLALHGASAVTLIAALPHLARGQSAAATRAVAARQGNAATVLADALAAQTGVADSIRVLAIANAVIAARVNAAGIAAFTAASDSGPRAIASLLAVLGDSARTKDLVEQRATSRGRRGAPIEADSLAVLSTLVRESAAEATEANRPARRWYVGAQTGMKLYGEGTLGESLIGSARLQYEVPLAPRRRWRLPVVANVGSLAGGAATDEEREKQRRTLLSTAEGAFIALEPELDSVMNTAQDFKRRFSLSAGVKINSLKDSAGSEITFAQFRVAPTLDLSVGLPQPGALSSLHVTLRPVYWWFSARDHERIFGDRRSGRLGIESFFMVPLGGGTGLLTEVSAARGLRPTIRIGFLTEALAATGQR